jgi:hypothetical protein
VVATWTAPPLLLTHGSSPIHLVMSTYLVLTL